MKVGPFDLTYCSNIHAGETWAAVSAALQTSLPRIRAMLGHDGPFGIGLRLSAQAAMELEQASALDEFRELLHSGPYYVPTINGFPYGAFHGTRVKERVYLPDWRSLERVEYTNRLARLLVAFARDTGVEDACISTVPGAFRAALASRADLEAMAQNVLSHAAYLKRLYLETGVLVSLALEPEPACHLETSADGVAFFRDYLLQRDAIAATARGAGVDVNEGDVLRHVGLCLDACHMAVGFEDPRAAIANVRAAGIRIAKVQLSSAVQLRRQPGDSAPQAVLGRFAEDTYLHQVVTRGAHGLTKFTDLPDALRTVPADATDEWRVHFHVPLFLEAMSGFDTTQWYLADVIREVASSGVCRCLEVETYTWDVLPPEYRDTDTCTAIARELAWVKAQLVTVGPQPGDTL